MVRKVKANRIFANIVGLRRVVPTMDEQGKAETYGESVFGVRTGLFGHPTTTVLRIPDEKVVGCVEDVKELGEVVNQLGLLTLAALLKYNLALGPEGLAKKFAQWAGIDLTELQKKADEEAMEQAKASVEAVKAQKAEDEALTEAVESEADLGGEG